MGNQVLDEYASFDVHTSNVISRPQPYMHGIEPETRILEQGHPCATSVRTVKSVAKHVHTYVVDLNADVPTFKHAGRAHLKELYTNI